MKNTTICFLLSHVPNPRINKRIESLRKIGDVIVICARRKSQNIWEPVQSVKHIVYDIDLPSSKHLFKRYIISSSFQRKVFAKLKELKPSLIYSEGLDSCLIATHYKKKYGASIVYEVADLRESFIEHTSNPYKKILYHIISRKEKELFKYIAYLVVTSPKFYDLHYCELIQKENTLFIPNKPNLLIFSNYKKKDLKGIFTIGFIGGIRYLHQMKMLVDAACALNLKVLFAGAGGTVHEYNEIHTYCENKSNVEFMGKYDYSSQIATIYGMVDCVYAVYDADNSNVRIALPNKLYEAILCELPIIVSKGTYLEELVNKWGVGVSVNHNDVNELIRVMERLKNDHLFYKSITDNCKKVKESLFSNHSEQILENKCISLINSSAL